MDSNYVPCLFARLFDRSIELTLSPRKYPRRLLPALLKARVPLHQSHCIFVLYHQLAS